jgi:prephenate dehydratase
MTANPAAALNPVAFQGEIGAYSELAGRAFFGPSTNLVPCPDFETLFASVVKRRVQAAVAPIENSMAGSIYQNYDSLMQQPVRIAGEISLRIHHNLVAHPGVTLARIKTIYSHPQALAQCSRYLKRLRPGREIVASYDTAGSVKMIKENNWREAAAIASSAAVREYGMHVLKKDLENDPDNTTRFLIVTNRRFIADGPLPFKTSLVFAARDQPGSLHRCLAAFAHYRIDLLKIESRPFPRKKWHYLFYLDFLGHYRDSTPAAALRMLKKQTGYFKLLGSYPRGLEIDAR